MNKILALICGLMVTTAGFGGSKHDDHKAMNVTNKKVVETYSDIALKVYSDSLTSAKTLQKAIDDLIAKPSASSLKAAKVAWIDARVPYQQSEVYRFGNSIVDDWEGKVNAWPLDEGFIDYVDNTSYGKSDQNPYFQANVIANPKLKLGSNVLKSPEITIHTLQSLHEYEGVESNVATGYHAIEFLLWGQDLNGHKPGAGQRSHTDYDIKQCTNKNCDRRGQYLKAAGDLLVQDLQYIVSQWDKNGDARSKISKKGKEKEALKAILTGMGSLSYGELAGERIKLGLMLNDPEEEHDCFSDNTHYSHYYDALGIKNIYLGEYKDINGKIFRGYGLTHLLKKLAPKVDKDMRRSLANTEQKMDVLVKTAESGTAYDQLLAPGNKKGEKIISDIVKALSDQTQVIQKVVATLKLDGVEFEGSDSLDNPEKVN